MPKYHVTYPVSTPQEKRDFILKNFPEVLTHKNIRMDLKLLQSIRVAMCEAGLYAKHTDRYSAGAEAAIIRICIDIQYQSQVAARKNKKEIDLRA